jgi:hypothetical protein
MTGRVSRSTICFVVRRDGCSRNIFRVDIAPHPQTAVLKRCMVWEQVGNGSVVFVAVPAMPVSKKDIYFYSLFGKVTICGEFEGTEESRV